MRDKADRIDALRPFILEGCVFCRFWRRITMRWKIRKQYRDFCRKHGGL